MFIVIAQIVFLYGNINNKQNDHTVLFMNHAHVMEFLEGSTMNIIGSFKLYFEYTQSLLVVYSDVDCVKCRRAIRFRSFLSVYVSILIEVLY